VKEIIELSKNKGVIYKFTSPSGKIYIGQSISFENRLNQYRVKKNFSIGKYLKAAIEKYSFENFKIELLQVIDLELDVKITKEKLNILEIKFISDFDCLAPKGYNLTGGGKGSYKRIITKETRKKLSNSNLGKNSVESIICTCGFCKKEFNLKPSIKRRRKKQSKYNVICCSRKCSTNFVNTINCGERVGSLSVS